MFRSYLVTALRNIARHKLYSAINIGGLAVGLTCVILIMLFARDQLSWDRWLPGHDGLYRVSATLNLPAREPIPFAWAPFLLPALMKDKLPEVTAMTRLTPQAMTVNIGDRQFAQSIQEVDENFFQVIRLPMISGDPATVLRAPQSIVLSETVARKFFGAADPVGRTVSIGRSDCGEARPSCPAAAVALRVTGVFRDLPHNSQIRAEAIISNASLVDRIGDEVKSKWSRFCCYSYVRLTPGSDPAATLAKLNRILDREVDFSTSLNIHGPASGVMQVHLTPYVDVHFQGAGEIPNLVPGGSWTTMLGQISIGLVILMAACFNFTNLATARAIIRAREIGLRKCVGARRGQVMAQFLSEAVVMSLLALCCALAAAEVLLPAYGQFLGYPIAFSYRDDAWLVLVMVVIAATAGLAGGFYPALVLSGFHPAAVLRGGEGGQAGAGWLRAALVVAQFTVSIALAIVTMVMFAQVDFARKQQLGFRHDHLVVIDTGSLSGSARDDFAAQLRKQPGITGVALSNNVPFSGTKPLNLMRFPGQSEALWIETLSMTPDFPGLYGMKLVAGRMLSESRGEDAVAKLADAASQGHSLMINQTAARRFGQTPEQAIGKLVHIGGADLRIVGVLSDAHLDGAIAPVHPLVFFYNRQLAPLLSARLSGNDMPATLAAIDRGWHRYSPSTTVSRFFLDDNFEALYRTDSKQGTLFAVCVGVAVFIAGLGLFGLAAFTVGRRTREIGLRKVFGARVFQIVWLLLTQFSGPVLLANLIAWPLAWYYLDHWLQGFAYRITLSPLYFLTAGLLALAIAWATVFTHALRVARANPIKALRYE